MTNSLSRKPSILFFEAEAKISYLLNTKKSLDKESNKSCADQALDVIDKILNNINSFTAIDNTSVDVKRINKISFLNKGKAIALSQNQFEKTIKYCEKSTLVH